MVNEQWDQKNGTFMPNKFGFVKTIKDSRNKPEQRRNDWNRGTAKLIMAKLENILGIYLKEIHGTIACLAMGGNFEILQLHSRSQSITGEIFFHIAQFSLNHEERPS